MTHGYFRRISNVFSNSSFSSLTNFIRTSFSNVFLPIGCSFSLRIITSFKLSLPTKAIDLIGYSASSAPGNLFISFELSLDGLFKRKFISYQ